MGVVDLDAETIVETLGEHVHCIRSVGERIGDEFGGQLRGGVDDLVESRRVLGAALDDIAYEPAGMACGIRRGGERPERSSFHDAALPAVVPT